MTEFEIAVAGEQAQLLSSRGQLTYRMAGAQIRFSFDGEWKELTPYALIRQGDAAVAIPMEENTARIPGHALTMVGDFVYAGVYGVSADGTVAIPTVWVRLGRLRDGAHIFYDEDVLPNTPVWQTLGEQMGDISRLQTPEKANLVDAVNSITGKSLGAVTAPETAQVGQTLAVAAVDEAGKPTQWTAAELLTREEFAQREWEHFDTVTLEQDTGDWIFGALDILEEGLSARKYRELLVAVGYQPPASGATGSFYLAVNSNSGGKHTAFNSLTSTAAISFLAHIQRLTREKVKVTIGQQGAWAAKAGYVGFCETKSPDAASSEFVTYLRISSPMGAGTTISIYGR